MGFSKDNIGFCLKVKIADHRLKRNACNLILIQAVCQEQHQGMGGIPPVQKLSWKYLV